MRELQQSRSDFFARRGPRHWLKMLALLALLGSGAVAHAQAARPTLLQGHFALETIHGDAVTERTYRGKWQLIYFGYTACPEVCPAVLTDVSSALDALGPLADNIQPLFISVDPIRDSAPSLATYLSHFNSRIVGLVGSVDATQAAARSYHVYYKARSLGDGAFTIDHSSFLFLMKPDGEFATLLSGELPTHKLADELRKQLR